MTGEPVTGTGGTGGTGGPVVPVPVTGEPVTGGTGGTGDRSPTDRYRDRYRDRYHRCGVVPESAPVVWCGKEESARRPFPTPTPTRKLISPCNSRTPCSPGFGRVPPLASLRAAASMASELEITTPADRTTSMILR